MSDLPPPLTQKQQAAFRPLAELVHALRFLTRLPVPLARTIDPPPLFQTMRMFSVAGAIIGALIAAVLLAADALILPPMLSALLASAAGLMLTGALHEDGLADTADGLGGGKSTERRLEIMRDSRIGSYGTLALIVAMGVRTVCLADLLAWDGFAIVAVLAAAHAFSRGLVVDLMWATRPARKDGLSVFAGQPSRGIAMFAILIGLLLTLVAGFETRFENAALALALGLGATAFVRWLAIRLIGGQTGDICGAAQIACELMMLTAFASTLH